MAIKEIHLIVKHPQIGTFIARKITEKDKLEDDGYIDRIVNNLERTLKNKGGWKDYPPAVLCRRIEDNG